MANHKWQPSGGCSENPGVFDSGDGGMIYRSYCAHCGLECERGSDYTGQRPGNTYGPIYTTPLGVRVGSMGCSVTVVARIDEAERKRQTAEAEERAANTRREAAQAEARNRRQRETDNLRRAGDAVMTAFPELRGVRLDVMGNDDYSFARFSPPSSDLPVIDFDHGEIYVARLTRNQRWLAGSR